MPMIRSLPSLLLLSLCHFTACSQAPTPPVPAASPAQPDTTAYIDLLFVGDIMGHGPQIQSARQPDGSYDYHECFRYIAPQLSAADLAIGNLEVTLPGEAPYQGYPQFRSPDALAEALRAAGFDLLVTANNHSNDAGRQGVEHTIDVLDGWGFHQTGTFKDAADREARYPLIVYKKGFKLAVLNYTYGTNGIPTAPPNIVNLIDEAQMKADLAYAQRFRPDYIISIVHWGQEYQLNESAEQRRLADSLFAWGSDLLIGAHPHVIQPVKPYTLVRSAGDTLHSLVAYSLGNFISNQKQPNTEGGLLLELRLEKAPGAERARLAEHAYTLIYRYIAKDGPRSTYYALPLPLVEETEAAPIRLDAAARQQMADFAKRMRRHLDAQGAREKSHALGH